MLGVQLGERGVTTTYDQPGLSTQFNDLPKRSVAAYGARAREDILSIYRCGCSCRIGFGGNRPIALPGAPIVAVPGVASGIAGNRGDSEPAIAGDSDTRGLGPLPCGEYRNHPAARTRSEQDGRGR